MGVQAVEQGYDQSDYDGRLENGEEKNIECDGVFLAIGLVPDNKAFENVCELDIMFNLEKAHFIVDEFFMNGCVVDANRTLKGSVQLKDLLFSNSSSISFIKSHRSFIIKNSLYLV